MIKSLVKGETISPFRNQLKEYLTLWVNTNNQVAENKFTWGSLYEEEEWHQYMSLDVLPLEKKEIEQIYEDTRNFSELVQATYKIVMNNPKYFHKLGLPVETWQSVSDEWPELFSYFCRYDIIQTPQGNKFIEINADTPTGYLETSVANEKLCELAGLKSPNKLEKAIQHAWELIIQHYQIPEDETIYFTSIGWHEEDRQTVLFNQRNCTHTKTEYIAIEEIVVSKDGLYTRQGKKINYLYRLYPLEYLINDKDDNGVPVGQIFLDHIADKNVQLINPTSAFVTQSKAFIAVMWDILENEPELYTEEEQHYVRQYVPKTFFSSDKFKDEKYVTKPLFGREGGGVSIIETDGTVEDEDTTPEYYNQRKICQEYIEMPDLTIGTWDGVYTGKLLIGSFFIGGEPSGIFLRVGEKITGNLSMFIGVGMKD